MDFIRIDKNSKTPLYRQISAGIEAAIESHQLNFGMLLPTEREICTAYNVSANVVKMAYEDLITKHMVMRIKGKGTFVTHRPSCAIPFGDVLQLDHHYQLSIGRIESKLILQDTIQHDPSIYNALDITHDSPVKYMMRVLSVNHHPIALQKIYIPQQLCGNINVPFAITATLKEILSQLPIPTTLELQQYISVNQLADWEARLVQVSFPSAAHIVRSLLHEASVPKLFIVTILPGQFITMEIQAHA